MNTGVASVLLIAVMHLPNTLAAQWGFIGLGAGVSRINSSSDFGGTADARASSSVRAAFGPGRVKVVLDWQRHGWADDRPRPADYRNGVQTREPEVLRTDFWLLGAQIAVGRGFYVRPAVGLGGFGAPVYYVPDGLNAESAEVDLGGAFTAGLSAGYHLRLHRRLAIAIEASALRGFAVEGGERRTIVGLQVTPLLEF